MPSPTPDELEKEIGDLRKEVSALAPLPGSVSTLDTAVQALKQQASSNPLFSPPQRGNVSTQFVGNGSFQAISPSFTGLAFGATAFKADESGVSFFGHTLFEFPWARDNTLRQMKIDLPRLTRNVADLTQNVLIPGIGLPAEIAHANSEIDGAKREISAVKARFGALGQQTVAHYLAVLSSRIRDIQNRPAASAGALEREEQTLRDIRANRDKGRVKGAPYEYNQKQIESLERSIKALAEAIGV
jgi:hypothetical protein